MSINDPEGRTVQLSHEEIPERNLVLEQRCREYCPVKKFIFSPSYSKLLLLMEEARWCEEKCHFPHVTKATRRKIEKDFVDLQKKIPLGTNTPVEDPVYDGL